MSSPSRHQRRTLQALSLVALAGCSVNADDASAGLAGALDTTGLIDFAPSYSAYDGVHDYRLTLAVPSADPVSSDPERVDAASIQWQVDDKFLALEPDSQLPGAVLLTTRRAGKTTVQLSALTVSGHDLKSSAVVNISAATPELWELGDKSLRNSDGQGDFAQTAPTPACSDLLASQPGAGRGSCASCHAAPANAPQSLTQFPDDVVAQIFSQGLLPAGLTLTSPFLRAIPDPNLQQCIFASSHDWDIQEDVKLGIVFKLRSLPPQSAQPAHEPEPSDAGSY
jgi:hypothetical protein